MVMRNFQTDQIWDIFTVTISNKLTHNTVQFACLKSLLVVVFDVTICCLFSLYVQFEFSLVSSCQNCNTSLAFETWKKKEIFGQEQEIDSKFLLTSYELKIKMILKYLLAVCDRKSLASWRPAQCGGRRVMAWTKWWKMWCCHP